ncbi:MAG: Hydrogenase assembly chaperone HypC/HupF [Parcubacteria group bacterium GW2011_GWC2_39_14]|nr:MAG: Hydrogenase assembly chaperone HypC/HupF [Parcubacteria group bacterium GW2011_GWC2_39_14]KKR55496.1 MAG: Hydrogenase assembly chaperone HypC/HupF [Parcubacteria group bacterium GW2011_GWA2_40_23]
MCLTLPAQIIKIDGQTALVKTHNNQEQNILISTIKNPQINDWIMINGNLAIQKISNEEAQELINILK